MGTNKVILYIAASLDGYIAKLDGSVEWLNDVEGDGGDNGYAAFYDTIGTVVMGRLTYDVVLELAEEFIYKDKPCYVMSRSQHLEDPHVIFTDEAVDTLIPRLKASAEKDIWLVGGGQLVQLFLEKQLIDIIHITIIPKVLGEGIELFPKGTIPSTFRLKYAQQMGQMVTIVYEV